VPPEDQLSMKYLYSAGDMNAYLILSVVTEMCCCRSLEVEGTDGGLGIRLYRQIELTVDDP